MVALGAKHVAVVDDDDSVRESLCALLTSEGYSVTAYASAVAFLESGHLNQVDCIIADVRMPGLSGPQLQDALDAADRHIPTIFITAYGSDGLREQLLGAGAVDCLDKPFSSDLLLQHIRRLVTEPS